eukprot:298080-Pyramimonas_sp.AAC.2
MHSVVKGVPGISSRLDDEDAARRVLAAKDKVLERRPNLELNPGTPFTTLCISKDIVTDRVLVTDQSDAGSAGIFSRRANRLTRCARASQEEREHSEE